MTLFCPSAIHGLIKLVTFFIGEQSQLTFSIPPSLSTEEETRYVVFFAKFIKTGCALRII